MDFNSINLFGKKSFSDLLKEIYDNSKDKEKQIKGLIQELAPMIKTAGDAVIIVPLIKEYLEIAVKNDEHLIKMAGIVQRASSNTSSTNDDFMSDKEKEELLKIAKDMSAEIKETPVQNGQS